MSIRAFTCVMMIAAMPALAQEPANGVDLIPGHPIYHDDEGEAGVAMAVSITPGPGRAATLLQLCDELRAAAGLATEHEGELRLETIFVVPYKDMAVEGLYLPGNDALDRKALVRGEDIAPPTLDRILSQAGVPPRLLAETDVEHEVSCATGEPLWYIAWQDVRPVGHEQPGEVIERARQRFLAVYQSVVEHNANEPQLQHARRANGG